MSFTHLHLHTEYSLLDGLSRIDQALDRVKSLDQEAAAITDHGNLYGAIDFYKAAHQRGIKPLIGIEAYVAPGSRFSRDPREKSPFHLGVIARNLTGFSNLLALSTTANLDGYYYKPRMDRELFEKHADGLLVLSGCPSSEVHRALQEGRREDAIETIKWYREVFDGHYYLEVQEHQDEQFSRINPMLIELGRELGIPVVVTNDSHYTSPEDEEAHDILLCIGTNSVVSDPKRMKMEGGSYYIKSEEEMAALFPDNPEVIANTQKVADSVDAFELQFGRLQLPDPELPEGRNAMQHLARLSWDGLARLYPDAAESVRQRMEYELSVVEETGFPAYILLVREFAQYARSHRIPFGVRGSAAASIILYCTGITDIDPMKNRLVFERFLNRERREMPDIDMDIADDRRAELIKYVADRFGHDRVAQIITFGTLGAKAAIRDVGRALGMSPGDTDRLARLVPATLHMTIDRALNESQELRQTYEADPAVRRLVDTARQIEGVARHASTHAAGVVIAKDPLVVVAPLQRPSRQDDQSLPMVCWDMNTVAEIGLLKMDFLGLSNLTILGKAVDLIRENRAIDLDLKDLPDGDEKTYEMLRQGETFGVFQLESSGMRRHIQELRPGSIGELSAMVALYRPGPMAHIPAYCKSKHGEEPVRYPHADLAEILDETYGIIVYQDQVLLIAQKFGGYTLGQADIMRKAMGKKIAEKMRAEREHFRDGAGANGYTTEDADKIFDLIEPFAGYAFNKCVVGSTRVSDAMTGRRTTVGELFASPEPFFVHALGEKGKLRPRRVTDVLANGYRPVYELRTAQGHRITATANHPFRTLDGWTNLSDLRVGDSIAALRRLEIAAPTSWPRHEIIVLAGLLSEGNTCHPSTLYFCNNDSSLIEDFAGAASAFPDTVARVTTRENARFVVSLNTGRNAQFTPGMRPWNATGRESVGAVAAPPRPVRSGVYTWAEYLDITWKRATEKRIPDPVFTLCDDDLSLLVGRLWSGDGFIANATNTVPFYATSSRELAYGLQTLLLRLGIVSGVHEKRFRYRGGERPGWTVHLVGEEARERFLTRVAPHIVGRDAAVALLIAHREAGLRGLTAIDTIPTAVSRWVDTERKQAGLTWQALGDGSGVSISEFARRPSAYKRGFRRTTIQRLADFLSSEALRNTAASDVFWDRVVAIEPRGVQPTFDLTVEEDHNFVADGLIVHNSHAVCYGTISYQTAYLKANYAAEYMTAVLMLAENHPAGFADRVAAAVAECAKLGLPIMPPDVNQSDVSFRIAMAPDGRNGIRFGLATVKNVGSGAVEGLIEERTKSGPFASLEDFCRRANLKNFNKRMLESLVKAGALDDLAGDDNADRGQYRSTLLFNIDRITSIIQREQRLRDAGQTTMFDMFGESVSTPMPDLELLTTPSLPQRELLGYEKELLGVYVSEHPFRAASIALATSVDMLISEVSAEVAGRGEIRLAGMVNATRPLLTKDGRAFCAATIEDLTGQVEVTVWPDVYEAQRDLWTEGKIVRLTARVRQRDERLNVSVVSATEYDPAAAGGVPDTIREAVEEVDRFAAPKRPEPANGYRNGNGRNGNGYKSGTGNGGGTAPPAGPPPRLLVRIEVTERPDAVDDDRRRLNELIQQLQAAPGRDNVRLVLVTRADRHELELPPVTMSSKLEDRLKLLLDRDHWGQVHTEAVGSGQ